MKIIKGFETRASGLGKYKTTLAIKAEASSEHINSLFNALDKGGFEAHPCVLEDGEIGLYIGAKGGDGIKEKFIDEFSVGETLHRTLANYIDEATVAAKKNSTLAAGSPKALKGVGDKFSAFLQQGTRQDRLERAMLLYAVGDVLGVGVGIANHDPKDAAFASFAGTATGLGYLELKFSDGKTKAQALASRILSEDNSETASTIGDAGKDFVKSNGMHFFNLFNFASFVPITQAGAAQGNIPKFIAGVLGLGAWFIRSFVPQKGYSGLIDVEKFGKESGIEDTFNKFEEKHSTIGGYIRSKWDDVRENPASISGVLNIVRNALMYGITAWSWTVGPAEMANLEHKYATGEDTGYKRGWVDKIMAIPAKIAGIFVKIEDRIKDPKRFHQCDKSGKVVKHWWEMTHEESQAHLKELSTKLTSKEHKELEKDITKYWHKKWMRTGGLLNLMMITSYFAANTILGDDKEVEVLNLNEFYSQLALAAMAKSPSHRDKFITDIATKAAFEPEIREHPEFINQSNRSAVISQVKRNIYTAINTFENSPFSGFFAKNDVTNLNKEAAANSKTQKFGNEAYIWNPLSREAQSHGAVPAI